MTVTNPTADELETIILDLNRQLLNAIAKSDYSTYASLAHPKITYFLLEGMGHLVEGISYQESLFKTSSDPHKQIFLASPHVRLMGEENTAAIVCYTRLTECYDPNKPGVVLRRLMCEETRIWERQADGTTWKNTHTHRSKWILENQVGAKDTPYGCALKGFKMNKFFFPRR